jgi:glutamate racemase
LHYSIDAPIGVFDSGIGGLSVLLALQSQLPHEHFVYCSDSAHAPYGERDESHIVARSQAIAHYLVTRHDIKALVVACNTATAQAIESIRVSHPMLIIIGIEPALKPAAALSATKHIGVLATSSTVSSSRFHKLLHSLSTQATFFTQPCNGLADAIERVDRPQIQQLIRHYVATLIAMRSDQSIIDIIVLGCTHYPLVLPIFQSCTDQSVQFLEVGEPVAKRTRNLLDLKNLLALPASNEQFAPDTILLTTGSEAQLEHAAKAWLGLRLTAQKVAIQNCSLPHSFE